MDPSAKKTGTKVQKASSLIQLQKTGQREAEPCMQQRQDYSPQEDSLAECPHCRTGAGLKEGAFQEGIP